MEVILTKENENDILALLNRIRKVFSAHSLKLIISSSVTNSDLNELEKELSMLITLAENGIILPDHCVNVTDKLRELLPLTKAIRIYNDLKINDPNFEYLKSISFLEPKIIKSENQLLDKIEFRFDEVRLKDVVSLLKAHNIRFENV